MDTLSQLARSRGHQSSLISLLVPANSKDMTTYVQLVNTELVTANNIKDRTNRKNVINALKQLAETIKKYRAVPETGIAFYAGQCV